MSFNSENKTTDGFLIGNSFLFASHQAEPEPEPSIPEAEPSTESPLDESVIDVSVPSEVEAAGSFLFASGHNHDGHVHVHDQDQSDDPNMPDLDLIPGIYAPKIKISTDAVSDHAETTTEAALIKPIEISSVVDVKIPTMPANLLETEIGVDHGKDYEYIKTTTDAPAIVDAENESISISNVVDVKISSMPADLLDTEIGIANEEEYTEKTTTDALAVDVDNEPVSISQIVDVKIPLMPSDIIFDDTIEALIREEMEGEVMKMKMNTFGTDPIIDTINDIENLSEDLALTTIANIENDEIRSTDSGDEKTTALSEELYDQVSKPVSFIEFNPLVFTNRYIFNIM